MKTVEQNSGTIVLDIDGQEVEAVYTVHHLPVENYSNSGTAHITYWTGATLPRAEGKAERDRLTRLLGKIDPAIVVGYTIRKRAGKAGQSDWVLIPTEDTAASDTRHSVSITLAPVGFHAKREAEEAEAWERMGRRSEFERGIVARAKSMGEATAEAFPALRIKSLVVTVDGHDFTVTLSTAWGTEAICHDTHALLEYTYRMVN